MGQEDSSWSLNCSNASSPRLVDMRKETMAIQKAHQTTRRAEGQCPSGRAGTRRFFSMELCELPSWSTSVACSES